MTDMTPTHPTPASVGEVRICKDCGERNYSTSFRDCPEKRLIDSEGICFTCAFWRVRAAERHETVIDGRLYTVGNRPEGGRFNGMAGRRFDIEYFDGRKVTTYDLWSGAEIPERYREAIPNTARFLNGAGFVRIGDSGAWNPSTPAPATSLPNEARDA